MKRQVKKGINLHEIGIEGKVCFTISVLMCMLMVIASVIFMEAPVVLKILIALFIGIVVHPNLFTLLLFITLAVEELKEIWNYVAT